MPDLEPIRTSRVILVDKPTVLTMNVRGNIERSIVCKTYDSLCSRDALVQIRNGTERFQRTSALLHDELWPGNLPVIANVLGCRLVGVYLFGTFLHFYLVVINDRVRCRSRVVGSIFGKNESFPGSECTETHSLDCFTGEIGSGYWKNHLYSGLSHVPVGRGIVWLEAWVAVASPVEVDIVVSLAKDEETIKVPRETKIKNRDEDMIRKTATLAACKRQGAAGSLFICLEILRVYRRVLACCIHLHTHTT